MKYVLKTYGTVEINLLTPKSSLCSGGDRSTDPTKMLLVAIFKEKNK
jgi:hypothetical protein